MKKVCHPVLFTLVLAFLLPAFAQQLTKRLILKDGNYQLVVKWEVHGERVRYYSAERSEWEELPTALIDWPATDQYNKDLESGAAAEAKRQALEDEAEAKAAASRSPAIAPGLTLPDSGGVYLLDPFQSQRALVELVQSGGELHKNMGRNILIAAINPLASSKQSIELKGARARVQAHQNTPEIYVDVNQTEGSAAPDEETPVTPPQAQVMDVSQRFRIVRAEKKKASRVIGNLKVAFYGKVSQQENWIPTTVSPVSNEWVKVTPARPIPAGEYALVEVLGKEQINLYVWDFGVDPTAPANPSTWTSAPSTQKETPPTPELQSHPK